MKISYQWLKKYIPLTQSVDEIEQALTIRGLEVENITSNSLENVVTAKILTRRKHPNADKLFLCTVTDGTEIYPVVCGASNVKENQIVFFAKIGAVLPGNFTIKKSKIRGEVSLGMICASEELGLEEKSDGILELDVSTPIGKSFQELKGDTVFEISITPNRGDALSHIGYARELASFFNLPLTKPKLSKDYKHKNLPLNIKVNSEVSSQYTLRKITGVKIEPSPNWLVETLQSIGQKSINNIVDLTNYVLMEYGQPSHTFDLNKINDKNILVDFASKEEKWISLTGEEKKITPKDVVIATEKSVLCLAGIMGGKSSEVDNNTTDILLEVAHFDPSIVRKSAKRQQIITDSSYRFERGIDQQNLLWISDYLAELIVEVAGGSDTKEIFISQKEKKENQIIPIRPSRIKKILGVSIGLEEIISLLETIEIKCQKEDDKILCSIPGFRNDVTREIDLIEEVARLYNFNNIPTIKLPHINKTNTGKKENFLFRLRNFFKDNGLNECISMRFTQEDQNNFFSDKAIKIQTPLSKEWEYLVSTPLIPILQSIHKNQTKQIENLRFFEIGKGFEFTEKTSDNNIGVKEENLLVFALNGSLEDSTWQNSSDNNLYFKTKGLLENLFSLIKVSYNLDFEIVKCFLHPKEGFNILVDKKAIGFFGSLHPEIAKKYNLKNKTVVASLNLDALYQGSTMQTHPQFQSFSTYSTTSREMNILVDKNIKHQDILNWIYEKPTRYLQKVVVDDVYTGENIDANQKVLHYKFIYQSLDKTLTDKEVNKIQEKLANHLLTKEKINFK